MGPGALLLSILLVAAPAKAPPPDAAAIWAHHCQACHGADGRARTRVGQRDRIDDFTETGWQAVNTDAHIRRTIAEGSRGNPRMKAFQELLTPEELDAVVAYIRTLGARGPPAPTLGPAPAPATAPVEKPAPKDAGPAPPPPAAE